MKYTTEDQINAGVKRQRIMLALAALPIASDEQLHRLHEWEAKMPMQEDMSSGYYVEYKAVLTADLQRFRWHVLGNANDCVAKMGQFVMSHPLNADAVNYFVRAMDAFQPYDAEMWFEITANGMDVGTWLDVETSLATIFAYSPHQNNTLKEKLLYAEVGKATRLGYSLGEEGSYTMAVAELNGYTVERKLEKAAEVFDRLNLPFLSPNMQNCLKKYASTNLQLSFWWGDMGLLKLGIHIADSNQELMLRMLEAAKVDKSSDEVIAAFEAALKVEGPLAIEWCRKAEGEVIELEYRYS